MDVLIVNQEAYLKVMKAQEKALIMPILRDEETLQEERPAFTVSTTTTTKTKKVVRFDTVTVHEHPIIIGCNPAVSNGVPITIAWKPVSSRQLPVNEFELDRQKERVSNPISLKQTKAERWNTLQNLGFPSNEMRLAEQEAKEIRCLRRLTSISENPDDTASLSRLQALLEESRARRERILKQRPRRSMLLRRFFCVE